MGGGRWVGVSVYWEGHCVCVFNMVSIGLLVQNIRSPCICVSFAPEL